MKGRLVVGMAAAIMVCLLCYGMYSHFRERHLLGAWQNSRQSLSFNRDATFVLHFKETKLVRAFRGNYFVEDSIIRLSFGEYLDGEGNWHPVEEIDLDSYVEELRFSIVGATLVVQIVESGAFYEYTKNM